MRATFRALYITKPHIGASGRPYRDFVTVSRCGEWTRPAVTVCVHGSCIINLYARVVPLGLVQFRVSGPGQVRFVTRPKSRTMRATRQLLLPRSNVT